MSESLSQHRKRIAAEHRECGKPKYDGCYSHVPMPHCRACGMALPCDVMRIAPALSERDALAAVAEAARLDIRWLLDNSNPMHYQGCAPDGCSCGVSAAYEAVIDRQAVREAAYDRTVAKP